ncbi:hypothetical protein HYD_4470 [Candidatus Hydrogenosomobacter endosymbioticus]|uniref:Transposase n=1 Tax=Candidatus Hydrogenosomobacter endosymbioticus TaxID=2558174 RepID=A0ABM7V970_9PROT|nr:hypothetical protein HYD_4470 [Candidatus Hydrogenosomobacter endosymbioticus]
MHSFHSYIGKQSIQTILNKKLTTAVAELPMRKKLRIIDYIGEHHNRYFPEFS